LNQDRTDDDENREIRISVGYINDGLLPNQLTIDDLDSWVPPGVACDDGAAGGYDCILVYADESETVGQLYVRRFSAVGSMPYSLSVDSPTYTVGMAGTVRTAGRIAAWYHNSKFWIAFRPINQGQELAIMNSTNGSSWNVVGSYGYTAIGPSATTAPTGVSIVAYAR